MMDVLSLFDGMSCGQIALEKSGIKVDKYYASEIDKYSIQVTMANYPDTIQLGDITKWRTWHIDWASIDIVLAGSPCQGFSFAGKGLNFGDERSKLFFVFVEILNHIKQFNSKVLFLLENVKMKHEHELIISKYMKVNPITINSNLLSAQNRMRLYWTNINEKPYGLFGDTKPEILQPKDKGIFLKDILEPVVNKKYYLSNKMVAYIYNKNRMNKGQTSLNSDKALPITTNYGNSAGTFIKKGFNYNFGNPEKKTNTILSRYGKDGKECLIKENPIVHNLMPRTSKSGKGGTGQLSKRDGKTYCLDTGNTNAVEVEGEKIRKLTPVECERLQTVPDNYSSCVSDTQRYKMLGNGWTVDVIAYIFSFIKQ